MQKWFRDRAGFAEGAFSEEMMEVFAVLSVISDIGRYTKLDKRIQVVWRKRYTPIDRVKNYGPIIVQGVGMLPCFWSFESHTCPSGLQPAQDAPPSSH